MKAFTIIYEAGQIFIEEFFKLLLMGTVTLLGVLLIIPGPFCLAGLSYVAQKATAGEKISWQTFTQGIKNYSKYTGGTFSITILGYLIVLVNIWFYRTPGISPLAPDISTWVTGFWIAVGVLWTGVVFYFQAFLLQQTETKIFLALRNSLYFTLLHPLETLLFLTTLFLLLSLCTVVPPFIILYPSFSAVLSFTALRTLLTPILERREKTESEDKV